MRPSAIRPSAIRPVLLLSFLSLCSLWAIAQQWDRRSMYPSSDYGYADIQRYTTDSVPSQFSIRFPTEKERTDFKGLREFLKDREELRQKLWRESAQYEKSSSDRAVLIALLDDINNLLANPLDGNKVVMDAASYSAMYSTFVADNIPVTERRTSDNRMEYLVASTSMKKLKSNVEAKAKDLEQRARIATCLKHNLTIVEQDIYFVTAQIDSALAPEYQKQEFRSQISVYFTLLIALLLCMFFYIVYKKSDSNLSKELLSGYGLQFITLFVLIIAIILFGILGILGGSELAAILSGISGYILGKGVGEAPKAKPTASANINATNSVVNQVEGE